MSILSFEYSKSIEIHKRTVNLKALNGLNKQPYLRKQSSLDSKIESIFDEQEHVQNEVETNGFHCKNPISETKNRF